MMGRELRLTTPDQNVPQGGTGFVHVRHCDGNEKIAIRHSNEKIAITFGSETIVMDLISFHLKTGAPAQGQSYLPRPLLAKKFWAAIANGNHLLIVAPRRVGKTSLMLDMQANAPKGYRVVLETVQSIKTADEFFKRLYEKVLSNLPPRYKTEQWFLGFIKRTRIEEIGMDGVKLSRGQLDYQKALLELLAALPADEYLVLMVDEFPQTVEHIRSGDGGAEAAAIFLEQARELRQSREVNARVRFVLAGSIGLEQVAEQLEATNAINDLDPFQMPVLKEQEADELIARITNGSGVSFPVGARRHLYKRLGWLIPFFVQLLMKEVQEVLNEEKKRPVSISKAVVDLAFERALSRTKEFTHWYSRLAKLHKGAALRFTRDFLALCAERGMLTFGEAYDLAVTHGCEESERAVLAAIEHDGYIHRDKNERVYRFNSPLLRAWWTDAYPVRGARRAATK